MKPEKNDMILYALGALFVLYYCALQLAERPGKLIAFSLIWLFLAAILWTEAAFSPYRRMRKKNRFVLNIFGGVFLFICLGILAFICYPLEDKNTKREKAAWLIVLGGGILQNGEPSATLVSRLDRAIAYIDANPEIRVIVSGGQGKNQPCPEADSMYAYIIERVKNKNVPILKERSALDTIQNMAYSLALINKEDSSLGEVVILTSGSHMRRSIALARMAGFPSVTGISSPTPLLFYPNNYLREIGSYWKLALRRVLAGPIYRQAQGVSRE